ncbi:MAG: 5-formyltetrahydrofolate cyclo-ligase [Pseudomonadota bacterium]|nr:5-formyltetrahydrofolate cyclo-ligase [Pseudomonadota bacterium]
MAAPHLISAELIAAKRGVRARALAIRGACDPVLAVAVSLAALNGWDLPPAAVVAGFWPIGDEIDIRPLLRGLTARGHPVVLPVTGRRGTALTFRLWQPGDVLIRERFGTMRPTAEERRPDALIVPLLAFDRRGYRVGYGGGFYDRTLAGLPGALTLGAAYAAQEVDRVPVGPLDVRLDTIATEQGLIHCKEP